MSFSIPQRCARQLLRAPVQRSSLPLFLTPAFSPARAQCFSTTSPMQSRVGANAITFPSEVSLSFVDLPKPMTRTRGKDIPTHAAKITGPRGALSVDLPTFVNIKWDETGRKATVSVQDPEIPHQRAMWGTIRALLQNNVLGVSEGHVCVLSLVGVGYRASIEPQATTVASTFPGQQFVSLKVGFSHPVELGIPEGIQASTPQPTKILLESANKKLVTEFATKIRDWRRPEPYKGKGIFLNGEKIQLKAKKIK
ncbi:Ribosomal protein L6 bacterial-type [Penicillium alfredii]|uniref:Ribosomal protein L6 bacterial-type n=1 Tax=Penicillium alfredii TaxID=1506179 RepID=A0A9W9FSU3_9EURO|nr:Ribosomal protein L6 bacterial-type [Penicillium alfredii]KAJ5105760.1 Ribosomal protein L6 bacterial-type [Penicillium alfredii]